MTRNSSLCILFRFWTYYKTFRDRVGGGWENHFVKYLALRAHGEGQMIGLMISLILLLWRLLIHCKPAISFDDFIAEYLTARRDCWRASCSMKRSSRGR